jgi:hypothetical protein
MSYSAKAEYDEDVDEDGSIMTVDSIKKGTKRKNSFGDVKSGESNPVAESTEHGVKPVPKQTRTDDSGTEYKYTALFVEDMVYIKDACSHGVDATVLGIFNSEEAALKALLEKIQDRCEYIIEEVLRSLWNNEPDKTLFKSLCETSEHPEDCELGSYFVEKFLTMYRESKNEGLSRIITEIEELLNDADIDMGDNDYKPTYTFCIEKHEVKG